MIGAHAIKIVLIVVGAACFVVAYSLSPYLTQKFNWIPETSQGKMLLVLAFLGAILLDAFFVG
jgi:hypothetical protein